ncbi:MAG: ATP-binding protein, partial [Streptosporangiaceae bacterium]
MRIPSEPRPALLDRDRERAALDGLLGDLRLGRGGALVVRGEAGVGKSALLEYVVGAAADMRVAQAAGVESEMELAFAGLHLLCAPLLGRLEDLPGPQRDALGVAFGLRAGGAPDRFLVGLAVLTLLSEVAEERPLLCVVDDAQWLDQASAQVLAFAARRLLAEPVGLIFAAREPGEQFRGLPDLEVRGLPDKDARALLDSAVGVRLDEQVRDRIVAETNGNPLALLELPRGLSPTQLAGGFGLVGAQAVPARIEQGFRERLAALPRDTRSLMLVAAAEPAGDPVLILRAAALVQRRRPGLHVRRVGRADAVQLQVVHSPGGELVRPGVDEGLRAGLAVVDALHAAAVVVVLAHPVGDLAGGVSGALDRGVLRYRL